MKELTVKELIKFLERFPADLPVAYSKFSEQCLLSTDDIYTQECCEARPDGWIQDARPDKLRVKYLMFPGN